MFVSKPLKLSILTLITAILFFGCFFTVKAQNIGQIGLNSSSTAKFFSVTGAKQKISQSWQDIRGEFANIQVREIIAGIKDEWQKEIIEMKQSIADLWRKCKERIIPAPKQPR